eukprot:TRINITY_DN7962_c0_g1_i1.p1 TRINITY_DN7962_c0_g1~~TRINITY_DN7962_c0_g1_i1.p1  ORF type:complete len:776 (+),score=237.80 TRINITY_DN7962_c0_g1_i1:69-2396(+)
MSGRATMHAGVSDVEHWPLSRVAQWLRGQGLQHLIPNFEDNDVDGATLLSLEKNDLREELGISALGDRKSLWESVTKLKEGTSVSPTTSPRPAPAAPMGTNTVAVPALPPRQSPARAARVPTPLGSGGGLSPTRLTPVALPTSTVERSCILATPLNELPPWRGGPRERCEECFKPFGTDIAVRVALPGASRAASVHRHCKDTWAAKNAKKCQYCLKLMLKEVVVLTGGSVGRAEVHPECADAYEKRLMVRASPRTEAHTPRTFTPRTQASVFREDMGRCDCCQVPFSVHDEPVTLQLPGQDAVAKLHPHCKRAWAEAKAIKCDHCGRGMPTEVVQLTGADFGAASVHPTCVEAFKASLRRAHPAAQAPPRSTPPAPVSPYTPTRAGSEPAVFSSEKYGACDLCGVRFIGGDDKITLTLPGNGKTGTLHSRCKTQWAALNAAKCAHCFRAMPDDIVTLTGGAFGKADVHPGCVEAFKRNAGKPPAGTRGGCAHCKMPFDEADNGVVFSLPGEAAGVEVHNRCKAAWAAANAKKCAFCNEALVKQQTTLTGAWGTASVHPECVEGFKAAKSERCDYCFKVFEAGQAFTRLTLPGETKAVKLHEACEEAYCVLRAKLCDHCKAPMTTSSTTLSGAWGTADVHPECVADFKAAKAQGAASVSPPRSGGYSPAPQPSISPPQPTPGHSPAHSSESPDSCYQCKAPFGADAITMLRVNELPHECALHTGCIEDFHRSLGHVCGWCDRTMLGHMTELRGDFGAVLLHPGQCLAAYKDEYNIA